MTANGTLEPFNTARIDESDDGLFYRTPRLVAHIDSAAQTALSAFYLAHLPCGGRILDLMSSYVSHLPARGCYGDVVGVGLNLPELQANEQLDDVHIQNLNSNPTLPFEPRSFDACLIAVSIQYLTAPVEIFEEAARMLKPGSPMIVSYSNRMFPTKAIAAWTNRTDWQRGKLIETYFERSGNFDNVTWHDLSPHPEMSDPLYAVIGYRH